MIIDKYNRIIVEKLPKNIATELQQIATDTDKFEDEELVEIYKDNFNDLFAIIEKKHPEALKPKAKLVKKDEKKKIVKKADPKKKIVKKNGSKVQLKSLLIHWAEGSNDKYDKFPKEYKTWEDANKAVIPVYKDLIESGGAGYNKVKFTATFEDGEDYVGRLDVSENEDNPTKTNSVFGLHIKEFLEYIISDKSASSEKTKQESKEFLDKYDLGLEEKQKKSSKSEPIGPTGDDIDLSMLIGKEVLMEQEGNIDSGKYKIKEIFVTDKKFEKRDVVLSVSEYTEEKFPLSKLESFLKGEPIITTDGKDAYSITLLNSSEIDCETAIAEVKAIHAKREAATKKRADAPKKKVTTAAREKQIKTFTSVFKTKEFKADKKQAEGFAKDIVAVYNKYGLKSMAEQLEKDIQELIDTKYKKAEK